MNSKKTKPGSEAPQFEFIISREFNAPRDRVWRAWTEAEQFGKWWGPKDFKIVSLKLDLRPGGICHYLLRSPDGADMWGKLVFREIVPEERLVFIVSFSDEAGGVTRHPLHEGWLAPSDPEHGHLCGSWRGEDKNHRALGAA